MKYGRAILDDVEGYVPGEQPDSRDVIKLNTNENPYPPSPKVMEALQDLGEDEVRKYPNPVSRKLREACAARYGFDGPEWVFAGNGMDEILAMALRSFVDPSQTVLSVYPTYTLYEVLAQLHGAQFTYLDLSENFELPAELFEANGALCFLPRPNAPTGVCATRDEVAQLCERFNGIVVIDEAYADFAGDNCLDFPKRFDNVIVTRTFSKSFSLAGMRLGLAFAHPDLIAEFMKTKDSYNVNAATQAAGFASVNDYAHMEANVAKIRATRERLRQALLEFGFDVPESQANFVLARRKESPSARTIFEALKHQKIYVRYFDAPRLSESLRITVGTDSETDRLLEALRAILRPAETSVH